MRKKSINRVILPILNYTSHYQKYVHSVYYNRFSIAENKIKEYETQLKQQRKVKDVIDEIDSLRTEKEQNEKDLNRFVVIFHSWT